MEAIFIAKFTSDDGYVRWAQKANGIFNCIGRDITTDNTGQVYVSGDFRQAFVFYNGTTSSAP